ncbi:uncharacterized protein LOC113549627 [Rhopalosiphum maidis]|uniref:uncharacterized protein LOC113549627 n=1 Tax=Rhopalosiphum maidis TaxID=43146 RepID=UPI000EFE2E4C|nr:uncharacterized protein LOC113549627 [Rhopalosiphum maidis]
MRKSKMIITWLCFFMITFNICSEGKANGSSSRNKSKSLTNSLVSRSRQALGALKRLPNKMKPLITWIRKYIDFGIKCNRLSKYQVICRTKLTINGKRVFSYNIWNKIPGFLKRRLKDSEKKLPPQATETTKTY